MPLVVAADFAHFVAGFRGTDDFATDGGLFEQGIGGHATAGGVATLVIIGSIEPPFGPLINNIGINDATGFIGTRQETFVGDKQGVRTTFAFLSLTGDPEDTFNQ